MGIDPSVFYWIGAIDNLITTVEILLSLGLGAAVVTAVSHLIDDNMEKAKIPFAIALALTFILMSVAVFAPDKERLLEMLVAQYINDNAGQTLDGVLAAVERIAAAMNAGR